MIALPNPHDVFFKRLLSDVAIARDFFQIHLPKNFKQHCDLSTIQIAAGSYVEDDLRQHFSDVLYSIEMANQTGYIYTLIEHVSQAKPLTPF